MGMAESKRERMEQMEVLLQFASPDGLSIVDLEERLGIDRSTAHRYLKEIGARRDLIQVTRGHYCLDPAHGLSNVSLYPSEALSIYLALRRFIRQSSHAPDFMLTALKKVVPAIQRHDLVDTLGESIRQMEQEFPLDDESTSIWNTLLRGWREQIVVRIVYLKARTGEESIHEIEPLLFEPATLSQGTYVIAWSLTRNELRTFKIDRIMRATLTTLQFESRGELNANVLLRHSWGIWYGEHTERVELLFAPEVARRVMETVWHPGEEKQVLDDGRVLWTIEIAGTREILSWVRGWGHEVKVLAPQALRDQVAKDLRAAAAQYGEV